jgi:hypothetical protein
MLLALHGGIEPHDLRFPARPLNLAFLFFFHTVIVNILDPGHVEAGVKSGPLLIAILVLDEKWVAFTIDGLLMFYNLAREPIIFRAPMSLKGGATDQ